MGNTWVCDNGRVTTPIDDRFWAKVKGRGTDGCWEWTANQNGRGYGILFVHKKANGAPKLVYAHRFSWELHNGPIPDGLIVMHRCDNRVCINPTHLMLGTYADNSADMIAKGRSVKSGPKGTETWNAKLTEDDVRAIRQRRANGEWLKVIAADYGVSIHSVDFIAKRKTWRHVE